MAHPSFSNLIDRYLSGTASESEAALVDAYLINLEKGPVKQRTAQEEQALQLLMLNRIKAGMHQKRGLLATLSNKWFKAAAAAILIISASTLYLIYNKPSPATTVASTDIAPGKDAAILTLENGKQIILDYNSGAITTENGIKVINTNGLLAYNEKTGSGRTIYHTITTARGNQYQLQLEDGTRVWLNSASSLRYPVAFTGNNRAVELTGEGYFEVSQNKSKPFIVRYADRRAISANKYEILVLGTSFNLNTYAEEGPPKASLLEGSIKLIHANHEKLLQPGEQAIATTNGIKIIPNIDMSGVIAWKNGIFLLDNADLPTIMRQISRWYDVDIVYEGKIPERKFSGGVSKNLPLSVVIKLLKENGIECRQEGKKLIVRP